MRKITEKSAEAFKMSKPFRSGNTMVGITPAGHTNLFLHGNLIASRLNGRTDIAFTLAGWPTPTTRERLRGIGIYVYQRKNKQYISSPDGEIELDENAVYKRMPSGRIEKAPDTLI